MSGRWLAGAVSLIGLGAATGTNQMAPSTTRYRIDSKLEQVVDLTAVGQPSQTTVVTQVALLTLALKDTVGGQTMHTVIDSLASDSPAVTDALAQARGGWVHGTLDSWGRAKVTATSADSNTIIAQLKGTMIRFFPILKPGARQGDTWMDTSTTDIKTPAQTMKSTTITTFTHGGSTTHDGQPATRIDATSETIGAGTMENAMAGSMQVEVKTLTTSSYFVGTGGRFLGGESKADGNSTVRTPMAPLPIPVTIKQVSTFAIVK